MVKGEYIKGCIIFSDSTPSGEGFKGCLYRAQFDNIYPFKRVFQDPRPDYIKLEPEGRNQHLLVYLSFQLAVDST